jgi:hypothetical protein
MTTACPVSENATVAQSPLGGWGADIDDAHRRWWGPRRPGYVTRGELLDFAQRQIAHLMNLPRGWDDDGGLPVTPDSAKMALAMLAVLISGDNLATPQISPQGNGGLDIEWLVSGNHLSLSVAEDGHLVLWATKPDGVEDFSFDSTDEMVDREVFSSAIDNARRFLSATSAGVRSRVMI